MKVLQWDSVYYGCNYIYAVIGTSTGSGACFITGCLELENFIAPTLHIDPKPNLAVCWQMRQEH
jgi:hypothetical protein